jgi:TonB family protein
MSIAKFCCCLFWTFASWSWSCQAFAADSTVVAERLHHIEALNRIDDSSINPWHLKLSFQLMDAKGHPSEQGTIEEWWKSPSTYKVVFSSPSYSSTEIHAEDHLYRTKDRSSPPYLLDLVLQQVVHPLTDEDIRDGTPNLEKHDFGKIPLDCIMVGKAIKNLASPPLGLFPTYCLDRDKDILRASYNFGSQTVLRNNIGVFQKRMVPMDQLVQSDTKVVITVHVEELRGVALQESDFAATNLQKIDLSPTNVERSMMAGRAVSQPKPVYPDRARYDHVSGTVRLAAIIGTDGKIHSLKFISIPDPDLGIAAVRAVRQWRYQPFLLNGVPVDVQTEITVNFEFR